MDPQTLDGLAKHLATGASRRAVLRSLAAIAGGGLLGLAGLGDVDARACPKFSWCWRRRWRTRLPAPARGGPAPEVEASGTGVGTGPVPEARRSEGEVDEGGGTGSASTSGPTPTPCIPGTIIGYREVPRTRIVCRNEGGTQVCAVETYTEWEPIFCGG